MNSQNTSTMKNHAGTYLSGNIVKILTIALCFFIAGIATLNAQDIIYVSQAAGGANDGTSWTDAFTDLQPALDVATKGDQVWVATGTYKPSKDKSGDDSPADNREKTFRMVDSVFLYGGFAGNESSLGERNIRINETRLSGDLGTTGDYTDDAYHVVTGINNYLLDGFTVLKGNASGFTPNETDMGGGIHNKEVSNVKIVSCILMDNRGKQGGAIANYFCLDSVIITGCRFFNNTAINPEGNTGHGGAIANWDFAPVIKQCVFKDNYAYTYGGAIYNWGSGSSTQLINCSLYENSTESDGGTIHNRGTTSSAVNCILWGNPGDEIANTNGGNCTITYCDIDQDGYSEGTGCFNSDPMIYIWGTKDYWIDPASPCVDAGDPASPNDPDDTRADIGIWSAKYTIDLSVRELVTPSEEFLAGARDVTVSMANLGTTEITSCDINWTLNGVPESPYAWSGNLALGDVSDTLNLGNKNFASGYHTVKIWLTNITPGSDEFADNDTLQITLRAINELDIGLTSVVEPLDPFQYGVRDIRVSMKNFSEENNVTSASIGFTIDGAPQTPYSWTGDLEPGETDTVTIKQNHDFTEATHTIKAWTYSPNGKTDDDHINDTIEVTAEGCSPIQGGTFYIQSSGGDFTNFTDAVSFLTSSDGIEGPVVFIVESNTYNEQILIPDIPGTSETNTITFRSASGDSNDVILTYSAGDYVVRLQQAEYIVFKNMTISSNNGHVITFHNSATHNLFLNNRIIGTPGGSALIINTADNSYPIPPDQPRGYYGGNIFANNLFKDGSHGLYFACYRESKNIRITGNIFENHEQQAIRLDEATSPVISDNTITSVSTITGVYLYYCKGTQTIEKNTISLMAGGTAVTISRGNNYTGIPDHFANNFIHVNASGNHYGIYLDNLSARTVHILHNSFNITGSSSASYAVKGITQDLTMVSMNNIFCNKAGGNTLEYFDENISSDYNCYYSNGTYFIYNRTSLAQHQSQFEQDLHSYDLDPMFLADDDLHTFNPFLNGQGTPLEDVTADIDGETRDALHPDIGADEYDPMPALSGTYDIGPSASVFKNFSEAIDSLTAVGVDGPVTFLVEDHTYTEQVTIPWIANASETNTITFIPANGDSSQVIITHAASGEEDNYTLKLDGARFVTLQGMTFEATGTDYARVVEIGNESYCNAFNNSQFLGVINKSELVYSHVFTYGGRDSCNVFENNLFLNGVEGIHMEGNNYVNTGLEITGNTFIDQTGYAVYLKYYIGPMLTSNKISSENKITAVFLDDCKEYVVVKNNRIVLNAGGSGIEMKWGDWGSTLDTSLIYNNHIYLDTDPDKGIFLNYNSLGCKIAFNTIHLTGDNASSVCLMAYNNEYKYLRNNILVNSAHGKVFHMESFGGLNSDYNNLLTNGSKMSRYSGGLNDWQEYYSRDLNSFEVDPYFEADSSYRPLNPYLKGSGVPVAGVIEDIDGEARDAAHPDIGADEFTTCNTPISGTFTVGGASPDYPTLYDAVKKVVCCGVDGPVIFNIATDTITGQFSIQEIPGASETNTVSFQSASGDSTDVLIHFTPVTSSKSHTILLDGADYITLKGLSVTSGEQWGHPVKLTNGATHNQFLNNRFYYEGTMGSNDTYALVYAKGSLDNDNTFISNLFENGSIGIRIDGTGASDSISGTQIKNNIFSRIVRRGIQLINNLDFVISGNQLEIVTNSYNFGICVSSSQGLLANNFIRLETSSTGHGIFLIGSDYSVYHNTVKITGNSTNQSDALWFNGEQLRIVNNVFANLAGGRAMRCDTTGLDSDHNLLFTSGSILVTNYTGGFNYGDLSAWQDSTGNDLNSRVREPVFVSDTNLHTTDPWLNNWGTPLAEVSTDIDGEQRDAVNPDVGADEFAGALLLSGEYTIGPSGDYASFTEAVDAISPFGIMGAVTFIVETGTYSEQFIIPEIPEVTETDNVTFRSATGDSTDVVVEFSGTASDNYVVQLDGARYITFEHMTFRPLDTAYANIIEFTNGASGNVIANCKFEGREEKGQVFYSSGSLDNDNQIRNNLVTGGNVGVYMLGEGESILESGLEITGNQFIDQFSAAVYLKYQQTPMIINNRIRHDGPVEYEWAGIFLINCTGGYNDYGLTANNTVALFAETKAAGIVLDAVSYQKVIHNSVNIYGEADESRAFNQQNTGHHMEVLNNIFSNRAEGLVIYTTEPGSFSSNHNDYYANGSKFIYHSANIADLQAWQSGYNKDLNSYSVDPGFLSDIDLHTVHPLLNGSGTPVAEVLTDMDGEDRDPAAPDIGADEFTDAVLSIMEDTTICFSTQLKIDAGQGYDSYEWNTGATGHGITINNSTGIDRAWYRVTVVKGENTYKDSVLVTFAGPYVDLGPDSTYCIDGDLVLDAGAGDFTYLWSDGSTDQTLTVPENGQYYVIVSDALSGCEDSDTAAVSVYPMPHATMVQEDTRLSLDESSFVSYQWYFNNEIIPGETNDMHYISQSGRYFVMFTDENGCTNTSDTIRYWFTGMENAESMDNIALYPNPASDHLYLRIDDETSPVRLYVVNSSGSMVHNMEITDPENQPETRLDVSTLPEGLYFIVIRIDGKGIVRKIVVE